MFKGTSLKDEQYFINVCSELNFLLESLGRMKQWWVSEGMDQWCRTSRWQDKAKPALWPADCASLLFWCRTQIETQKLICANGPYYKPGISPTTTISVLFRRNRSLSHLRVLPKFAPKAHVDMLTSLDCSSEMCYQCSIRIWSQRSKAWLPAKERIGRDFIQGTTSGFVLCPIQLHADSVVNPKLLQNCFI